MAQLNFSQSPKVQQYQDFRPWLENNLYCGFCCYSYMPCQSSLTIDHYKPVEHFPEQTHCTDNLLMCTQNCNAAKGDYHPEAPHRRNYKCSTHKIYNCRQEDVGSYMTLNDQGQIASVSKKDRFLFNERVFKFNHPWMKQLRHEALQLLDAFIHLNSTQCDVRPSYDNRLKQHTGYLLDMCARRYLLYKVFNIPMDTRVKKLIFTRCQQMRAQKL